MTERVVGRRIIRCGSVGSTMDEVTRLAAAGEPEGTVVVAAEQTAGRGRAGRRWQAPAGTAILCSVLLRPPVLPARLATLPLVVGVAVAEAIERATGLTSRLKWPNDVWLGGDDRKVAGILLAARSEPLYAVVGVGINVDVAAGDLPPGGTSLALEAGRAIDHERVFASLVDRLDAGYRNFVATGGAPDLDGWRARAALLGEPVAIEVAGKPRPGIMRGVDRDGALLLERPDGGIERIVAGDLIRGPTLRTGP